jgi:hypothetical protein
VRRKQADCDLQFAPKALRYFHAKTILAASIVLFGRDRVVPTAVG